MQQLGVKVVTHVCAAAATGLRHYGVSLNAR